MQRVNYLILVLMLLSACSVPQNAQGKPGVAVKIEYDVPNNLKQGDQAQATLRFVAKADLQLIAVKVTPLSGLELLSNVTETQFADVKKGESKEFTVNVKLLDEEMGYLSVSAQITSRLGHSSSNVRSISIGTEGSKTRANKPNKKVETDARGRKLIIHPATEK